jgi:hypothetical protein
LRARSGIVTVIRRRTVTSRVAAWAGQLCVRASLVTSDGFSPASPAGGAGGFQRNNSLATPTAAPSPSKLLTANVKKLCEKDPIRTRDQGASDTQEKHSSLCAKLVSQKLCAISALQQVFNAFQRAQRRPFQKGLSRHLRPSGVSEMRAFLHSRSAALGPSAVVHFCFQKAGPCPSTAIAGAA